MTGFVASNQVGKNAPQHERLPQAEFDPSFDVKRVRRDLGECEVPGRVQEPVPVCQFL
jgi:hypothetical protein